MDESNRVSTGEAPSDEPPLKVRRHEGGHGELRETSSGDANPQGATLFIRCTSIHGRGELLNGFISEHREALGVAKWYNVAGDESDGRCVPTLRTDAPFECVYVRSSRKPYFLLEFNEKGDVAKKFVEKLVGLRNTLYKGSPVFVEVAKGGLTVGTERLKLEKRDAARRSATAVPLSFSSDKPTGPTAFVPRAVRKR